MHANKLEKSYKERNLGIGNSCSSRFSIDVHLSKSCSDTFRGAFFIVFVARNMIFFYHCFPGMTSQTFDFPSLDQSFSSFLLAGSYLPSTVPSPQCLGHDKHKFIDRPAHQLLMDPYATQQDTFPCSVFTLTLSSSRAWSEILCFFLQTCLTFVKKQFCWWSPSLANSNPFCLSAGSLNIRPIRNNQVISLRLGDGQVSISRGVA